MTCTRHKRSHPALPDLKDLTQTSLVSDVEVVDLVRKTPDTQWNPSICWHYVCITRSEIIRVITQTRRRIFMFDFWRAEAATPRPQDIFQLKYWIFVTRREDKVIENFKQLGGYRSSSMNWIACVECADFPLILFCVVAIKLEVKMEMLRLLRLEEWNFCEGGKSEVWFIWDNAGVLSYRISVQ